MQIDLISIFPDYFKSLNLSLLGKAQESGILKINVHDLRDFTTDKHKTVDDAPYGGGPGMVMKADVWGLAIDSVLEKMKSSAVLIVPTPSGKVFNQKIAQELSNEDHLIFINGRYEGIDSRVVDYYKTDKRIKEVREISIGDYVLAGGEVASIVMLEAISRLVPGVLGNEDSVKDDSFAQGSMEKLIEGPVFTRPENWRGMEVPQVLLSGDHEKIAQFRLEEARKRTRQNRPDLAP
ncbi:MAG: tRNA (guanosine(37)-N1)-methyltransferase TrmD [Candidatus Nanopelagicales bacterium]